MRRFLLASLALIAAPAMAQPDEPADRPLTNREPNAMDVAATPATDLNLRKDEIPQLLIDSQVKTYDLNGLSKCSQLAAQIGEFDAILGDDIDLPQTATQRVSPGRIGQYVVGSFIPFRGILREVTGAADQRRRMDAAITAGLIRRAFLKGVGTERGCRYPARSATREVWDEHIAAAKRASEARKSKSNRKDSDSASEVATARRR
jgi:hypothetical protein